MSNFALKDLDLLYSLAGANITNAYQASSVFNVANQRIVRFYVFVFTDPSSNLTTITVKLQQRYRGRNNSVTGLYIDLPSNLDDVQGTAQPKGSTREIEHAFTVSANNTPGVWFSFLYTTQAEGDLTLNVHANTAGLGADAISIYGWSGSTAP